MSFWDNVKKFAQPYAEDDYPEDDYPEDDYPEEQPEQPESRSGRRPSPFATATAPEAGTSSTYTAASDRGASTGFSGQVLNMGAGSASGKQEVILFHAKTFDDAAKASDELRRRKAIILNMENVDKSLTRRVVDFLSGSVYALDGHVKKIAQSTYLFCPHNMDVVGDLENIHGDADSYI